MSKDDKPYSVPMTPRQRYRQEMLMYIRDEIISPIMPPIRRFNKQLNMQISSKDHILIDRLAAKHTDRLLALFGPVKYSQPPTNKSNDKE